MTPESLPFATPSELAAIRRELAELRGFVREMVNSVDDQVSTAQALRLTGLKSRTTPDYIERGLSAPGLARESTAEVLGTQADMPHISLPFVRPAAYATFAANCQDYNPEELERINVLIRPGVEYKGAVVIEVRGNSMAPRYPDRSCYVVRPVSDGNWQYATGVHCISLRSAMFVIKRITSSKDGILTLSSDNGGAEISVELGDILCMWKVGEAAYMPPED